MASLPNFGRFSSKAAGFVQTISTNAHEHADNYGFVFDGYVSIPTSGGYTFSVIARDGGLIEVDNSGCHQSGSMAAGM